MRLPTIRALKGMGYNNADWTLFAWERDTRAALQWCIESPSNNRYRAAADRRSLRRVLARIEKARAALPWDSYTW